MTRRIASIIYLLLGVVIALGAYGHGFKGRIGLDTELAKFAIAENVYTMIYVVWYFVSGSMLLFGLTIMMSWARLRRGDRSLVPTVHLIGVLGIRRRGIGGYMYRHGDPFMVFFLVLGVLLLLSGWLAGRSAASAWDVVAPFPLDAVVAPRRAQRCVGDRIELVVRVALEHLGGTVVYAGRPKISFSRQCGGAEECGGDLSLIRSTDRLEILCNSSAHAAAIDASDSVGAGIMPPARCLCGSLARCTLKTRVFRTARNRSRSLMDVIQKRRSFTIRLCCDHAFARA